MACQPSPAYLLGEPHMRIEAVVSPQFEICFALADLVSPNPVVEPGWAVREGERLEWLEHAALFEWSFWLALPDALGHAAPVASLDEFFEALEGLDPKQARQRLIRGLFHTESESETPTARKREWLAFVGLDDWRGENAKGAILRREAEALMSGAIAVLRQFRAVFEPVWNSMRPQIEASRGRAERLARACSLGELAQQLLLRIEVDEKSSSIRALRGGYELAVDAETQAFLIPSAFNRRRFWTVAEEHTPATIFFPYFDPAIHLPQVTKPAAGLPFELDPWLACKALGDPTRAAIVRRIAHRSQTGAELGRALQLSKANISHHIFQLREAGLIDETPQGRSMQLSLREGAINDLSDALLRELGRGR